MDYVLALWNVLEMVKTIDTSAKSLYFLKIGSAKNSSIECDCDLTRCRSPSRTGMNFHYAPPNSCCPTDRRNCKENEQDHGNREDLLHETSVAHSEEPDQYQADLTL